MWFERRKRDVDESTDSDAPVVCKLHDVGIARLATKYEIISVGYTKLDRVVPVALTTNFNPCKVTLHVNSETKNVSVPPRCVVQRSGRPSDKPTA